MTRVDLFTNAEHRLWYTIKVYSIVDVEIVMKAAVATEKAMDSDPQMGFFLSVKVDMLVAGMLYLGGPPPADPFKAFDDIQPMATAVPETEGTQHSCAVMLGNMPQAK